MFWLMKVVSLGFVIPSLKCGCLSPPPNVRLRPTWYARLRPLILRVFHQFLETGPLNLQVIEDFSGEFDKDQVHYTILSGIYYVQHLADRVVALLEAPAPVKSQR